MRKIQYNNLISSYAKALFFLSEKKIDIIKKEVEFLLNLFKNYDDVFMCLFHPVISYEHKKEIVISISESLNLNKNLVKFIMIVLSKRSNLLVLILEKFLNLAKAGELEIIIKSAEPLKEDDIKTIIGSIKFLGKPTKVDNSIDPSILGGFIIKYGFNLIDVSLKNYLDKLVSLSKIEILKIGNYI
ncbi:MAG: ATP synthase F1 subunit delta [Wolbachia endosymbiont of Menacanthus eurysternus]|nr:MAG: ATP synthase F1 subunit delta [Wolbachia endosymbiont of Menacanthus eurysternus]